jgi:hypothetical protein
MKQKQIKQLLEQYWQCETSLEDEQLLQASFEKKEIFQEEAVYKSFFAWKEKQRRQKTNRRFLLSPEKSLSGYFYPILKIAASVLIMIGFGISIYTYYQQEIFMNKVFPETFTNPEDAVNETREVVAKVSSLLQLIPEKIAGTENLDSIKILDPKLNDTLE